MLLLDFHTVSEERARILMKSFHVNLWFGLLAGLVFYLIGSPLLRHVRTLNAEMQGSLPWVVKKRNAAIKLKNGLLNGGNTYASTTGIH